MFGSLTEDQIYPEGYEDELLPEDERDLKISLEAQVAYYDGMSRKEIFAILHEKTL